MYMHTYNYISNIYVKNTFVIADFLPIHVQNFMPKKVNLKKSQRKNKYWAYNVKRHFVHVERHSIMSNGTVILNHSVVRHCVPGSLSAQ